MSRVGGKNKRNKTIHDVPKDARLLNASRLSSRFARTCFTTIALSYLPVWLTLDYLSDLMYMADMIITVRTGALSPTLCHHRHRSCRKHFSHLS